MANKSVPKPNDEVMLFTFHSPGISTGFGRPLVTLKGFDNLENKDSKRFFELMNDLKNECDKLEVHFKAEIYTL